MKFPKLAFVLPILRIVVALAIAFIPTGCTSLGQDRRAKPKIAERTAAISEFAFDTDGNELSLAIEKQLHQRGVRALLTERGTQENANVRYLLRVRSTDLDICVPEGSRQMHFDISVTDRQTRQRVLLIKGEYGCCNTIVAEFDKWLKENSRPPHQKTNGTIL